MTGSILVLNAGSSSLKFALLDGCAANCSIKGALTGIDGDQASLRISHDPEGLFGNVPEPPRLGRAELQNWLLQLMSQRIGDVSAIGHRIVHGGRAFDRPVIVDEGVLDALEALTPLAPLHEPFNIGAVRAAMGFWPDTTHVACFDTSFHRTQAELARRFPIPRALHDAGIQRYGFHGLSYDYIAGELPNHAGALALERVVVAHLGNGASLCAIRGGKSVATTMGMTALGGLMMGTRSGAIDPGVVLHLQERCGMTTAQVSDLLYNKSGLLGVSGISSDVRVLEASNDPAAAEALDLFSLSARHEIADLASQIEGLDVLVFTAGIGENSASVRQRICGPLAWLGVEIDGLANHRNATAIHSARSRVQVFVLPTNEEIVIARACHKIQAGTKEIPR